MTVIGTVMGAAAATRKQRPKVRPRQAQTPRKTPRFRDFHPCCKYCAPPKSRAGPARSLAEAACRDFILFDCSIFMRFYSLPIHALVRRCSERLGRRACGARVGRPRRVRTGAQRRRDWRLCTAQRRAERSCRALRQVSIGGPWRTFTCDDCKLARPWPPWMMSNTKSDCAEAQGRPNVRPGRRLTSTAAAPGRDDRQSSPRTASPDRPAESRPYHMQRRTPQRST